MSLDLVGPQGRFTEKKDKVPNSFLLLVVRHLLLVAWHLLLVAMHLFLIASCEQNLDPNPKRFLRFFVYTAMFGPLIPNLYRRVPGALVPRWPDSSSGRHQIKPG